MDTGDRTGNRSRRVSPSAELVDVVDELDRVVETVSRGEMRARNLRHRAAYIFVFNDQGQLYVHKRTADKDVYPSYHDLAAGGVVLAGEDYDGAAKRELEEELGIAGVPLRRLFPFRFTDEAGMAVNGVLYTCTYGGTVRIDPTEIESGDWMDLADIVALAQAEPFCPDSFEALRLYLAQLEAASQRRV